MCTCGLLSPGRRYTLMCTPPSRIIMGEPPAAGAAAGVTAGAGGAAGCGWGVAAADAPCAAGVAAPDAVSRSGLGSAIPASLSCCWSCWSCTGTYNSSAANTQVSTCQSERQPHRIYMQRALSATCVAKTVAGPAVFPTPMKTRLKKLYGNTAGDVCCTPQQSQVNEKKHALFCLRPHLLPQPVHLSL